MSLERDTHYTQSSNFFMSFAQSALPVLLGESILSNFLGLLPSLGLPLVMLIGNFVSLIIFIIYLCPGYFKTRKENLSATKQKIILVFSIVCILGKRRVTSGMVVAYVLFSLKLTQAMDESKYAVCMFYNAQFDIFNGLTENFGGNNYSFLGFDRLESYTEIFKEELTFFSDLNTQFVNISTKDFKTEGNRPIESTKKFVGKFKDRKTLTTTDGVFAQPVWAQSLTSFISDSVQTDIESMLNVATNLEDGANTGKKIISDFKSDNYVLVSSMSRAMDFVINKFKKLLNSSVQFDGSIEYVLNFFDSFRYFLIVLGILLFAAVPFYFYYYSVRTNDDEKVWLDKIMKLVNLFVNFMGYISGVLLLIMVFIVTIQSCFCFYLNAFVSDPTYYNTNKTLFQIKDTEMSVILENCLDPNKAKFSFIFNKSETNTQTETQTDGANANNTGNTGNTGNNANANNGGNTQPATTNRFSSEWKRANVQIKSRRGGNCRTRTTTRATKTMTVKLTRRELHFQRRCVVLGNVHSGGFQYGHFAAISDFCSEHHHVQFLYGKHGKFDSRVHRRERQKRDQFPGRAGLLVRQLRPIHR